MLAIIFGTRPEIIKFFPVIKELRLTGTPFIVVFTGQHLDLVQDFVSLFDLKIDIKIPSFHSQSLSHSFSKILFSLENYLSGKSITSVMVQGDTLSSLLGAMWAFYNKVKVVHLEAGLRSNDIFCPFPEEVHRVCISKIADLHLAPTATAANNLLKENVSPKSIFDVGNTVVDTLDHVIKYIKKGVLRPSSCLIDFTSSCLRRNKNIVLLTMHRRESEDHGFIDIASCIEKLSEKYNDIVFAYVSHPNPITLPLKKIITKLEQRGNAKIFPPLSYVDFVFLQDSAKLVMTDSGGVFEESVVLGKKIMVLRNKSERLEPGLETFVRLVGFNKEACLAGFDFFYKKVDLIGYSNKIFGSPGVAKKVISILQKKGFVCNRESANVKLQARV